MPKYVIEREIPGAGNFTDEDLKGISQKSCGVLDELGTSIQWIHSYVTGDKMPITRTLSGNMPSRAGFRRTLLRRFGQRSSRQRRSEAGFAESFGVSVFAAWSA
jgi:hypothetical protein